MDEDSLKKLNLIFKDDDINRILKANNINDPSLKSKKVKINHLMEKNGIGEEILRNLESLKGCRINSLKDSIYRIDENLSLEFKGCNSIPTFLSYLYKLNMLDKIPFINAIAKFSSKQTTKFTNIEGVFKYSDPKINKQKIEKDVSILINKENEHRDRHIQIKNIELNEDQKIIIIGLLIEQGKRTIKQFGFRNENSIPKDYSLKKMTFFPVSEKMIKVDYGKNESTTTIDNLADLVLYKKIIKCFYKITKEGQINKIKYFVGKDAEEIKKIIESRRMNSISKLKKNKPFTELDQKKVEILQKIDIKEIGFIAKDAPFDGGMNQFSLIAGYDFQKLLKSMKIEGIVNTLIKNSRDFDIIIEYQDQNITITREKWEGRNLSEIEREVIDTLLRE